ncbi:hypothetical protein [Consotaella salsifontis]|uniref:Uncharacterized protein n=1 Tax=Consotaella salsifontis TaxID=1365950 RepID=A0A1T4SA67_9HYPH|nr:hypothetical protein [Consotaella salsifontis]SKA24778.1 hypothetical protein SAMN05428963_109131 [Consotaella salsifontis]
MAAISHVHTIQRAAEILGRNDELLWDLSDQLEPEDGVIWIIDVDDRQTLAFTDAGIDALRDIIADQIDVATKTE